MTLDTVLAFAAVLGILAVHEALLWWRRSRLQAPAPAPPPLYAADVLLWPAAGDRWQEACAELRCAAGALALTARWTEAGALDVDADAAVRLGEAAKQLGRLSQGRRPGDGASSAAEKLLRQLAVVYAHTVEAGDMAAATTAWAMVMMAAVALFEASGSAGKIPEFQAN